MHLRAAKRLLPVALVTFHLALAGALTGCATSDAPDSSATTSDAADAGTTAALRVRKNVKHLSPQEKQDFVAAVLALKAAPPPAGITQIVINDDVTIEVDNYYDMFVAFHQAAVMETKLNRDGKGVAHTNAAFPPWHRKLLFMYETALRDVSGLDVTLPYWDWTDQASTDAMLSADFMGPSGDPNCTPDCAYAVTEGPFRRGEWTLTLATRMDKYVDKYPFTWIVRAIGHYEPEFYGYPVALPTKENIATAMAIPTYDVAPFDLTADITKSFRNYLEGFEPESDVGAQHMHNIGHDWISGSWKNADGDIYVGTMEPLDISPSDPIFFIHHCNVDRLWAEWQKGGAGRIDAYAPDEGDYPSGWKRNDEMFPYDRFKTSPVVGDDITPGSQLDFEALGFTYDTIGSGASGGSGG